MKRLFFYGLFFLVVTTLNAQDSLKNIFGVSGYISTVQTAYFSRINVPWVNEDFLHNRLQFSYNTNGKFFGVMHLRNRLIYGNRVTNDSAYFKVLSADKGLVDLKSSLYHGASYIVNSEIDRFYLGFRTEKITLNIGRQRINWGQTFVWNPNDIFNTYSFFDLDYPERPGSDAIRLEYYKDAISGFEFATKADSSRKITSAILYRFNKWAYDIQFLGGIYENNNIVLGTGWSGNIKSLGFYGEISYIRDLRTNKYYFNSSLALNYISPKSVTLQGEFLFSQTSNGFHYTSFTDVLNKPLDIKNLAFSRYSLFIQAGYPVNPLVNVILSGMLLPSLNAFYLGPDFTFSMADNLEAMFAMQYFRAKFPVQNFSNSSVQMFTLVLLRLKYSF